MRTNPSTLTTKHMSVAATSALHTQSDPNNIGHMAHIPFIGVLPPAGRSARRVFV